MTGPSSTPRGEHQPAPGVTWQTAVGWTGEQLADDDAPDPAKPGHPPRPGPRHTEDQMTDRHTVDNITSDQLDALYARLDLAEHEADVSVAAAAQLTTLVGKRSEKAEKTAKAQRQRARIAEGELRVLRAGLRANGADPTQIQNLWAQIRLRNRQWREEKQRAEQAEAERDGAYRERAQLLAWLAALHAPHAVLAPAVDIDDETGWWLLFLTVAGRQLTWHIAPRDVPLFNHVERVDVGDPRAQWDGHTTEEKYERIRTLPWGEMRAAVTPPADQTTEA